MLPENFMHTGEVIRLQDKIDMQLLFISRLLGLVGISSGFLCQKPFSLSAVLSGMFEESLKI